MYARIIEQYESDVYTHLRGKYNIDIAFSMFNSSDSSYVTRTEYKNSFKSMDADGK